jgi:hypothetical protein
MFARIVVINVCSMSEKLEQQAQVLVIVIILSACLICLLVNESFASNSSPRAAIIGAGISVGNFPSGIEVNNVTNKTGRYSTMSTFVSTKRDCKESCDYQIIE